MIVKVTGGVLSAGDPSMKVARQTTSDPLYTGMAGIVSISTIVPLLSLIKSRTSGSEYRLLGSLLKSQLMKASCRS